MILTNGPHYFRDNNVFETGLSDFHLMIATEFKIGFQKMQPYAMFYYDYKHFDNKFRCDIQRCTSEDNLKCFKEIIF